MKTCVEKYTHEKNKNLQYEKLVFSFFRLISNYKYTHTTHTTHK